LGFVSPDVSSDGRENGSVIAAGAAAEIQQEEMTTELTHAKSCFEL